METTLLLAIDYAAIARQLKLQETQIRETVSLLDEGNTVPFITRYRKDRTGGLDEEKIRLIQDAVSRSRQLGERKDRILRSIQSQDALTAELEQKIRAANSLKVLDDLYLPFRPKKQTLATVARQRGLEPAAEQVLQAEPGVTDLDSSLAPFVDPEKSLSTVNDVKIGVGHILAERFSERPDLRTLVRRYIWTGQLVSKRIENPADDGEEYGDGSSSLSEQGSLMPNTTDPTTGDPATGDPTTGDPATGDPATGDPATETLSIDENSTGDQKLAEDSSAMVLSDDATATAKVDEGLPADLADNGRELETDVPNVAAQSELSDTSQADSVASNPGADCATQGTESSAVEPSAVEQITVAVQAAVASKQEAAEQRRKQRREARHRKRQKLEQSFKDYFEFSEAVKKLPHYRVLAVNRGERCKVLRVKITFDLEPLRTDARQAAIPADHPYAELMTDALNDALNRLVVPSIEREARRELTERAESHAVKVFAQNLRKLLLQAPLRGRRIMAIDPGFRSGCKLAALDEFGNVLGHSLIHVIGAAERVQQSRSRLAEMVKQHQVSVVAIGNGTACRETEQLVAAVLSDELANEDVHYVIVNEAGASVYSTSQLGREELPRYDATVRGAVSIGRRALDPLSELVKIDPASIGVGLYQHDVKVKHLRASLDAVVESCVNYVGVDVNSASPALLSYVSGLNQLTARRVYEHRQKKGPFRDRQQLKDVPGVGDATYVQAAGFLKVVDGHNPLDGTWIHPESYDVAKRVLEKLDCNVAEIAGGLSRKQAGSAADSPSPSSASHGEEVATAGTPASVPETDAEAITPAKGAESAATVASSSSSEAPAESESVAEGAEPTSAEPTSETLSGGDGTSEVSDVAQAESMGGAQEGPPDSEAVTTRHVEPTSAESKDTTGRANVIADRLAQIDTNRMADEMGVGLLLLNDILSSLARPGRDPREDLRPPIFRREVLKLEDLKPGMELSGTVLNVVDFGAFVDIGLSDSGLIHISRLANRYVADPHEVVSVGDILNVWVVEVDEKRRRVSLTAIAPGTEAPAEPKKQKTANESANPPSKRRRPRRDKAPAQARKKGKGGRAPATWRPKPKVKSAPPRPITDAMADGKEPMRAFSDLQQFFDQKKQDKSGGGETGNQKS